MTKTLAALAGVLAALALAGPASAIDYGVTEDAFKTNPGLYSELQSLGMTTNVMSLIWDPMNPTALPPDFFITRAAMQAANARGIKVIVATYQGRARGITDTPNANQVFGQWLQNVARGLAGVQSPLRIIVLNEPNVHRFWQPQFDPTACRSLSPAPYTETLAAGYDALKAVDPTIRVYGIGLSPRGNDFCRAPTNPSHSPVAFLTGMGAQYRTMGRNLPLMDALSFHPYPNLNNDPWDRGYQWPNIGVTNINPRLYQAFEDAFGGTAQPTFTNPSFVVALDEYGIQHEVGSRPGYHGRENVPLVTEAAQADTYVQAALYLACDPHIESLNYFHYVDEADLDRFQSGFADVNLQRMAPYAAFLQRVTPTGGRCQGQQRGWRPVTSVLGARVDFGSLAPSPRRRTYWSFRATAEEDATFTAGIFRLSGRSVTTSDRAAIARTLASSKRVTPVAAVRGTMNAYFNVLVRTPSRRLAPGRYVYGIRLRAATKPSRTSMFVSRPFVVR